MLRYKPHNLAKLMISGSHIEGCACLGKDKGLYKHLYIVKVRLCC